MSQRLTTSRLATLALLLAASAAQAQVYRVVGPDGRVTFSDKPPATNATSAPAGSAQAGVGAASAGLPLALSQVAQRYPVTFYTGNDCAPCNTARNLLVNRGIPFSEKTVNTNADIAALQRQMGEASLPALSIGGQQLKGFSDAEWTQYLDAAGYPKTSQLPRNYSRPPATPLVAVSAASATETAAPAPAAAPVGTTAAPSTNTPVTPPERTSTNPAGIRF